jgi:uncharacterized protein (DUF1015 family)
MAILRPFRGITYDPSRVDVSRVVAPPYDVITPKDQVRYYAQDPHNVVRLIAGEVRPTDSAEDNKYLRAAAFFRQWLAEGILRKESERSIYVYQHQFLDPTSGEQKSRLGLIGVVELQPFGSGVLPHEQTHARAKADRLSLTRAVQANLSPIFSLYEDPKSAVAAAIKPALQQPPQLSITTEDGDRHAISAVHGDERLRALSEALRETPLYIADGHHRYETALNFRDKMRLEHPEAPPDAAFNFVLMLLVDVTDPGLVILPTHRIVRDLPDFDGAQLVERLGEQHRAQRYPARTPFLEAMQQPTAAHRIGIIARNKLASGLISATVDLPRRPSSDPVSALDVSVLHDQILKGQLGLGDELVEEERHISYSRDLDTAFDRVESGAADAAFVLRPPAVADVVAVAKAGQVMPQKSTYFYPKPASGIVFNPLDPAIRIPAV